MPYTGSDVHMSFHHTAPRVDHQESTIWLTAEAEHLKVTIFVTKAQGQQLVEDLIQVVGRRPQPEAAVTRPRAWDHRRPELGRHPRE
jgi:hypothetical protein